MGKLRKWMVLGLGLMLAGCHSHTIHTAISDHKSAEAKAFIEKGVDIESRDIYGNTPFLVASQYGDMESVSYLISKGADINARNKEGVTQQCPVRKLLAKKLDRKIHMEAFFS